MFGKRKGDGESSAPAKKVARGVKTSTCDKWVSDGDKEMSTSVWLRYERQKDDRQLVEILKCAVCIKFEEQVKSSKNFSEAFIVGSRNLRTSAFKDHAETDMHKRAMGLFQREQSQSSNPIDYALIAKS
eukprot:scpid100454/ scgid34778/ 